MHPNPLPLDDRAAIADLLAGYCHAIDASRADLCIRLFAEDAVLETPVGCAEGRDAILAWMEERLAERDGAYQVGHALLNPLYAPLGPDHVRVRSKLLYTRQAIGVLGGAELIGTGVQEDEVVRTAEGWRFQRRRWALSEPLDPAYLGG